VLHPSRPLLLLALSTAAWGPSMAGTARDARFLAGGDISMATRIEQAGATFHDGVGQADLVTLLRRNGWNTARLRLFVDPSHENAVVNDLPYTLALARRIKAAGMQLLLDIHYSDTWADPGHQAKPAAWRDLSFDALVQKVHDYTADVISQCRTHNVLPDIVQIGNEITPGFLWPEGKLYGKGGDPERRWERFTRLLEAGIAGAREAAGQDSTLRILIHIDKGGKWGATKWFFENLARRNVSFDIIGLSYYPWWHGTMADLRGNLHNTARTFGKDIMVVETAYPHRNEQHWKKHALAWPISPEGQKAFLAEVIAAVKAAPDGRGIGVLYWYPESVPAEGLRIWNGGATALFDAQGKALPALSVLGSGGRE